MIEEEIWGWRFPYHHNNNIRYPIIRVIDLKNYEACTLSLLMGDE